MLLSRDPCLTICLCTIDDELSTNWVPEEGGPPGGFCFAIFSDPSASLSMLNLCKIVENFVSGDCDTFLGITGELGLEESGEEKGDDIPLPLANGEVCVFFRQLSTGELGIAGELGKEAQIRNFGANLGEPSMFSVGGGQGVILRMRVDGDIGASF